MEPPIDTLRSLPFASLLLSHPLLPSFSDTSFFKLMLSFFSLKKSFSLFCLFFLFLLPAHLPPCLFFSFPPSMHANCYWFLNCFQLGLDKLRLTVATILCIFFKLYVYIADLLRIWPSAQTFCSLQWGEKSFQQHHCHHHAYSEPDQNVATQV